jgi:hypothetical protein
LEGTLLANGMEIALLVARTSAGKGEREYAEYSEAIIKNIILKFDSDDMQQLSSVCHLPA